MSGAWERFITSIHNFLFRPREKKAEEAPLHMMPEPEEGENHLYIVAKYEEEPSEVTLAEAAGFVIKREVEA